MFYNLDPNIKPKNLLDILKWKITSKKSEWLPLSESITTDIPPITHDKNVRVSYVGHVTFLIQVQGLNILTDPVWSERASPFTFAGPKRIVKPGIDFADLPKIDFILISHNHYDHLDIKTIKVFMAAR
ncbi:MAG TPA: MBL fold metallo-hydrolase [Rickettsia endosymbiont of Bembidion nr. Transversale]|nr:MBL fold metallo-hydrolase [Rickettsia endosymbiont of Bembidion nr. Transversale]